MVEAVNPIDIIPNFVPIDKSTWDSVKDKIPNSCFEENRARFYRLFKEKITVNDQNKAVGLFKGSSEVPLYSSDVSYPSY